MIKLKQQVAEGAMIGYQQERGQEKTCRYAQVMVIVMMNTMMIIMTIMMMMMRIRMAGKTMMIIKRQLIASLLLEIHHTLSSLYSSISVYI